MHFEQYGGWYSYGRLSIAYKIQVKEHNAQGEVHAEYMCKLCMLQTRYYYKAHSGLHGPYCDIS